MIMSFPSSLVMLRAARLSMAGWVAYAVWKTMLFRKERLATYINRDDTSTFTEDLPVAFMELEYSNDASFISRVCTAKRINSVDARVYLAAGYSQAWLTLEASGVSGHFN